MGNPIYTAKKGKVKELFIEGLTQKEITIQTGITEKTVRKWANEGEWQTQRNLLIRHKEHKTIAGLRFYLKELKPQLSAKIDTAILEYLLL